MKLTLAKPVMAAFGNDIEASKKVVQEVKARLGIAGNEWRVNPHLTIDFGYQPIVRWKDVESGNLGKLEQNLVALGDAPLAVHAPYNYGNTERWSATDLSQEGPAYENLLQVVRFADNIGAHSVAVHPNAIRTREAVTGPAYTHDMQTGLLERVLRSISMAQQTARTTSVDLENKPFPATTEDNENPIYTVTFGPLSHILRHTERGGRITFDTCHYGITRKTINDTIAACGSNISDEELRNREMFGYFAADYIPQPSIATAMCAVGQAINHIHLNDGSVCRPVPETGRPDKTKPLPSFGHGNLWWEAYVPGHGELCGNEVIIPWLRAEQTKDRRVMLTLEVAEFDGNYAASPRSQEALENAGRMIMTEFSS